MTLTSIAARNIGRNKLRTSLTIAVLTGVLPERTPSVTQMRPLRAGVSPRMDRTVVVLPAPLRPSSVAVWPSAIERRMPKSTWLWP